MRSIIIALALLVIPFAAMGDVVSEGTLQSGIREVPLMDNWHTYTDRGPIHFTVCSDIPVGRAMAIWNEAIPLKMSFQREDCVGHLGDGVSQIYAKTISKRVGGKPVTGYYAGTPMGEEDIVVDPEHLDSQSDLLNLLIHELGHALGLGDAYRAASGPGGCRWSVMLSLCSDSIIEPQEADLKALNRIHNWNQPKRELAFFDEDNNGLLDDSEFFNVIDAWVNGSIRDGLFFDAIDAWVQETPIGQGVELELRDAIEIDLYRLDGTHVTRIPGSSLSNWRRQADNGTYIYRARFPNGIETGKIAVMN